MLSSMGRNEEEDRYTAALAITQLSEVLLGQDDGSNGSAKFEMKDREMKERVDSSDFECKPTFSTESSKMNETPPLDLTLKKKPVKFECVNPRENLFCSEKSDPSSYFFQKATEGKKSLFQYNIPDVRLNESSNIIPSSNPFINKLQYKPISISSKLNTILLPAKPALGFVSVGTNNCFLSQETALSQDFSLPMSTEAVIGGFRSNMSNFSDLCKSEQASPSSDDDFIRFRPRGLSSLSDYYRNIGKDKGNNSLRLKKQIHVDHKCQLKHGSVVLVEQTKPNFTGLRVQNKVPSGLSSIKEYYRKGQPCHRLKHKVMELSEPTSRNSEKRFPVVPLSVAEVLSAECSGTVRNILRPTKPHKRKIVRTSLPAPRTSCSPLDTRSDVDFLGKHSRSTVHWDSETSHDHIEDNAEMKIPLKVLELSLADDSSVPESNCMTTAPYATDGPRDKGYKHRPDRKGKPLDIKQIKREMEDRGTASEVTFDFLNPDEDGDYIIHIAASQGDVEQMKHLLQLMKNQGGDVNCRDAFRQTPLHVAVETNDLGILSCLLEAGANPCLPDSRGQTCLHLAIIHNHVEAIDLMLRHSKRSKFNCNAMNYEGLTALHLAVLKNQTESANILIGSGLVDLDAKEGKSGKTALYLSAEHNRTNILSALLACGASDKEADYSGYTPYQAATTKQNKEIVGIFDEQKKDKPQT